MPSRDSISNTLDFNEWKNLTIPENGSGWASNFNTSFHIDMEDIHRLLAANDEVAKKLLPVMLFLASLLVIGIIGNSFVCFVFSRKFHHSSQNFLILCLATFDLLSCCLAIPYEIIDLRFYAYYVFKTDIICKVMKFVNTFCSMGSIFTLLLIAIDRYRKICKPLEKQFNFNHIRRTLFLILAITTLYSSPAVVMYGFRTTQSSIINGVQSRDCSIPDTISETWYPIIYSGILIFSFVAISTALTIMYSQILKKVRKRCRNRKKADRAGKLSVVDTQVSVVVSDYDDNDDDVTSAVSTAETDKRLPAVVKDNRHVNYRRVCSKQNKSIGEAKLHGRLPSQRGGKPLGSNPALVNARKSQVQPKVMPATKTQYLEVPQWWFNSQNKSRKSLISFHSGAKSNVKQPPCDILRVPGQTVLYKGVSCDRNKPDRKSRTPSTTIRRCASDITFSASRSRDLVDEPATKSGAHKEVTAPTKTPVGLRRSNSDSGPKRPSKPGAIHDLMTVTNLLAGVKAKRSASSKKRRWMRNQTTMVAFSVTLAFILSFLPHLSLMISKTLIFPGFDQRLKGTGFILYNVFLRSYFLNCVSNPIIYCILNSRFRNEVRLTLKRLFRTR